MQDANSEDTGGDLREERVYGNSLPDFSISLKLLF